MNTNNNTNDKITDQILTAHATSAIGKTITVNCPYCGRTRIHQYNGKHDDLLRGSRCRNGPYWVILSETQKAKLTA